MRYVTHYI